MDLHDARTSWGTTCTLVVRPAGSTVYNPACGRPAVTHHQISTNPDVWVDRCPLHPYQPEQP